MITDVPASNVAPEATVIVRLVGEAILKLLVVGGTGLKTLGGNTTVNGNITVGGTSGLNASTFILTVLGNWINHATLTPASSSINFTGSSPQSMSGTVVPVFNNLGISNASGVSMSAPITINGAFVLNNGAVSIGSNTLTINGSLSGSGSFVGSSTSVITIGGTGALGTLTLTSNTNLQSLTINRTSSGTVTLGSNVSIVTGGSLTLTEGTLDLGSNTLSVAGALSRTNGAMNGTTGTLVLNGSSIQNIPASTFTSDRLANLTINNAAGVSLNGTLGLTGTFTPTAGTFATNNNLTLVSDATNTARIANGGCTSCSYITGNVSVQRHVPATARRWRFMGSPLTTTTLADWKTETYITGVGGAANGFDATASNNASVFGYNETITTGDLNTGWEQATNITNSLVVGKGYRVFIRGDRSDAGRLDGTNTTQNAVTLDLVGPVNQGDIAMPVSFTSSGTPANDGWCLLANPYASPYDWNAHFDNGTFHNNIDASIQVLSAQTGGYVSYNASSNAGTLTGGIIPPGAAFWVKATGASPSLTFKEQFKVATNPVGVFKTEENESFSIKLEKDSITSDALIVKYMDVATTNFDTYDIRKMAGTVNISSYGSDNIQLSLTVRPTVTDVDTIKLNVSGSAGTYKLIFNNNEELGLQDNALLIDNYLSTVTDLKVASEYSFSIVTGNAATQGLNRFYIVTGSNSALPVKLLLFNARKEANKRVALNWSTAQEVNNSHFELQRSIDGRDYETIGTVRGNGTVSKVINYSYTDNAPKSINYYRLKQVDFNGTFSYSAVQMVKMDETASETLVLYPNPVKDEVWFSHSNKQAFVTYAVYTLTGEEVLTGTIEQQSSTLHLGSLGKGIYLLVMRDLSGQSISQKLIKD